MKPAEPAAIRYLRSLDAGDIDAVINCFANDATYGVPPPADAARGPVVIYHGHDAIRSHLERRGKRRYTHAVKRVYVEGSATVVVGTVETDQAETLLFASLGREDSGVLVSYIVMSERVDPSALASLF